MRLLAVALAVLLLSASSLRAAQTPDSVLLEGLRASQANGIEAVLRVWYVDRTGLELEMKEKLLAATRGLGSIIDTEVVAIQPISKRVTRYYVAIYFTRCPLWLRIERYANHEKAFYLPLRFSTNPDDIMPGYITEFHQSR